MRSEGSESDLVVFRNNTWKGGGTLNFPDGRHWLAATNFWQTRYEITTSTEETLLTMRRISGVLRMSSAVDIHQRPRRCRSCRGS